MSQPDQQPSKAVQGGTQSPFLRLPGELRNIIYDYSLDWNDSIGKLEDFVSDPTAVRRTTPNILLLNKQITAEALDRLHKKTFTLPLKLLFPQRLDAPCNPIAYAAKADGDRAIWPVRLPKGPMLKGRGVDPTWKLPPHAYVTDLTWFISASTLRTLRYLKIIVPDTKETTHTAYVPTWMLRAGDPGWGNIYSDTARAFGEPAGNILGSLFRDHSLERLEIVDEDKTVPHEHRILGQRDRFTIGPIPMNASTHITAVFVRVLCCYLKNVGEVTFNEGSAIQAHMAASLLRRVMQGRPVPAVPREHNEGINRAQYGSRHGGRQTTNSELLQVIEDLKVGLYCAHFESSCHEGYKKGYTSLAAARGF